MSKTILIVDDSAINRRILSNILAADYSVIEAEDGRGALSALHQSHRIISAILLDIQMPVMDGYEVLGKIQQNPVFSQIPVIVTTSNAELEYEKKALALGATDFVAKPFDADIIRRRLNNLVRLRDSAAMINTLQKDKLTGLWNRETFFDKAAWKISQRPAGYYVLSDSDVDDFKVINDQLGTEKGDEVLKRIADIIKKDCDANDGLCGRVSADNFIVLYPQSKLDCSALRSLGSGAAKVAGLSLPVTISTGRYIIDDKSLPVSTMYDRAALAQATVKGRYDVHVAIYDETMRAGVLKRQEIVNGMNRALDDEQFEVWFQPQYNHATGALIGAEALARWKHPERGFIPPSEFIPVFERNGFVYELDKFIWEKACSCLRIWIDAGRSPLPVSVNVSRYDLFCDSLIDVLTGLLIKYDIPTEMLRLEITESAFADSTQQVVDVVERLIERGFTVEIDDFGSGYSSLNTLKDVPAQIVKLDMRFLENSDNLDRGGNILESIVRMSKWLGMSVIAEGVEEIEQADFLKSIGCSYIQGYLYARPMPAAEYEQLARGTVKEERLITLETVQNLDNNAFWNPKSMDTLIFNSYVGAACIFEYCNDKIELVRVTDKYMQIIGNAEMSVEDALKLDLNKHLDDENSRVIRSAIQRSADSKEEVTGEFVFLGLPGCPEKTYLRSTLRVIATAGERYLVYCTNENITAQREAEEKAEREGRRFQKLMNDTLEETMPVILSTIMKASNDFAFAKDKDLRYLCCSPAFLRLAGCADEADVIGKTDFDLFSADMAEQFRDNDIRLFEGGEPLVDYDEVIHMEDGELHYCRASKHILRDSAGKVIGLYGVSRDITAEHDALERLKLLTGAVPEGSAKHDDI